MRSNSCADLFATFFRIGLTSFGMAILQNLKTVAVRRGFVSEQELQEGLALVQLYPGPIVANLVAFVGYKKGRTLGAFVAMLGFVLPAFALMVLASMAYLKYGSLPGVQVMQQGLNALVVGVLAHVTLHFAEQHIAAVPGALLAAAVFVVALMRVNPLWPILAGLLVGAWLWGQQGETTQREDVQVFEVSRLITPGLIAAALIAIALMASLVPSPLSTLLLEFMTIGAVAFGNGSTILPVMQEAVVNHRHWLTIGDFGVAIGLGHATPGPVLISATFVGYVVAGFLGALVSTFAIFAPSFAMTLIAAELFGPIRHLGAVRGAVQGVMTVFVGLMANVVLSLGRHAMTEPLAFLFAGLALMGVRYLKQDLLTIFAVGLTLWGILAYRGMVTGQ
jgi:chromate transporter